MYKLRLIFSLWLFNIHIWSILDSCCIQSCRNGYHRNKKCNILVKSWNLPVSNVLFIWKWQKSCLQFISQLQLAGETTNGIKTCKRRRRITKNSVRWTSESVIRWDADLKIRVYRSFRYNNYYKLINIQPKAF